MATRQRIDKAKRMENDFEGEAYSYRRAFSYSPSLEEQEWFQAEAGRIGHTSDISCLDPTAGGGVSPLKQLVWDLKPPPTM